jgi:asparagine synthase (glutamine-hydrolysing)
MVPTFLVSKVAREYVTVSLSGDGGDELFGGYNVYGYYNVLKMQKYYPKMLNKIGHMSVGKAIGGKAKAYFEIGTVKKEFRYASLLSYLSIEDFKLITGKDASEVYKRYTVYNNTDYLATAMKNDLHNYLPSDILTKVDRASLANSLESRPPLLDHRFVELSYSIDNSLKRKKGEGKYILKKALEGILPKEILYRKKQGFGFPLRHYLDKELKDYVVKYVLEYNKHNLFRKEFVSKLKRNIEKGSKKDYSRIIWSIMMFNMWWDEWME